MTKKFFELLILLAVMVVPINFANAASQMAPVGIFPFQDLSAKQSNLADAIQVDSYTLISRALRKTNKFDPMSRADIMRVFEEFKLQHKFKEAFDPSTLAKLGKVIGAKYVILGTITGMGHKGSDTVVYLSLQMIEVETARIYISGLGTGKASDANEAIRKATRDALDGKDGMLTMLREISK